MSVTSIAGAVLLLLSPGRAATAAPVACLDAVREDSRTIMGSHYVFPSPFSAMPLLISPALLPLALSF